MQPVDPHLPVAHLRPLRNWVNDPNGLVFDNGQYHVFFQYNPNGPDHGDIHWGHFRSPDLVRWELLPVALAPTPGGDDADGCWSGNAIADDGRLVAFYCGKRADRWWQPITTATSRDGGYTWEKRARPLIPQPPAGTTMYRDPYVWRQDGRWRMLVGAALEGGRPAALLYESPDLENWTYLGPFHTGAPGEAAGWECPQYATFGDRGVLVVSQWDLQHGPQHVAVTSGHEEHGRFTASPPVPLDHGPDFYAPALLRAPDGRWVLWGWAPEARTADWVREAGWSGALTLPRELTLADDGTVCQRPARELLGLRTRRILRATGELTGSPVDLGEVSRAVDLSATLTGESGLRLVTSADDTEYLDIRLEPDAGGLVVDRGHASRDPRARRGAYTLPRPRADAVDLRILVDGSIVEVYPAGGQVLTLRFYPTGDGPWRLRALGSGRFAAEAWDLRADVIHRELLPALDARERN